MTERRPKTDTAGRGLGHSFADDNVERGDPNVDFIKRRPTYPLGDDPRGREINFEDTTTRESYGSTRNPVVRAFRGQAPVEGQIYTDPRRKSQLDSVSDLRPELPPRTVDSTALELAKDQERALLAASDFATVFPSAIINSPAPGAVVSAGSQLTVIATITDIRAVFGAVLFINGTPVERKTLDRRDQDIFKTKEFTFFYDIPPTQVPGPMDITIRGFNRAVALQGIVADDAIGFDVGTQTGVGTLDGRKGQSTSSTQASPRLAETTLLKTPEAVVSISINIT